MKAILLLLASLVTMLMLFLGGIYIATNIIGEPAPHAFANMETPDLWTMQPKTVQPESQGYERLPSLLPPVTIAATGADGQPLRQTQTAATSSANSGGVSDLDQSNAGAVPAQSVGTVQADWCFARYKSYRVEDNTYQPFSGGARRQCEAPGSSVSQDVASLSPDIAARAQPDPAARDVANEPQQAMTGGISTGGSHEEWCMARYRSYDAADDSYQPFDGGPRRACQSPNG